MSAILEPSRPDRFDDRVFDVRSGAVDFVAMDRMGSGVRGAGD